MSLNELAATLGQALKRKNYRLATAESCTGGGVSFYITSVAGSSDWFECGMVTYSNEAKMAMLGVQSATLTAHGAVSEQTAREMATGALKNSQADIAVAITGIAGPDGGTADKPVGTVWFCVATASDTHSDIQVFDGNRESIREQCIEHAINAVLKTIS